MKRLLVPLRNQSDYQPLSEFYCQSKVGVTVLMFEKRYLINLFINFQSMF